MSDREFTISLGRYGVPQVAIDAIIKVFDEKEQFQQENKALQAKNDALVARVARLRRVLSQGFQMEFEEDEVMEFISAAGKALNETESESLADIKSTVIYSFKAWLISELGDEGIDPDDCDLIVSQSDFDDYANQLRQQAKP